MFWKKSVTFAAISALVEADAHCGMATLVQGEKMAPLS